MKGIKLGLVGVCFGLLGLSFGTNNILAISCACFGLIISIIGCFLKDNN